jgi:hypothetical protein
LCPCFFFVSLVISISFMFCWASQHYAESPCYCQSCERISVCWLHWPPPAARNWWNHWACCDRCSLTYKLLWKVTEHVCDFHYCSNHFSVFSVFWALRSSLFLHHQHVVWSEPYILMIW